MQKSKKLTVLAILATISVASALAQTTITLTGNVKDAISNQPISGALVQVTPTLITLGEVVTPKLALTDSTGKYSIPGLAAPSARQLPALTILVSHNGYVSESRRMTGTTADFGLRKSVVLEGRVSLKTNDGPGIDGVAIVITGAGAIYNVTTGGGGLYAVSDMAPGAYSIAVQNVVDYADYSGSVQADSGVTYKSFSLTPKVLQSFDLQLRCSPDTFINHGTPMCNAVVTLTNSLSGEILTGAPSGTLDTPPYCHYTWTNIAQGNYTLKVRNLSRPYHVHNASEIILLNQDCSAFQPFY